MPKKNQTEPSVASLLDRLDDEILYAILDVALDIDNCVTVSDEPIVRVAGTRIAVRYQILCAVNSVPAQYRYLDLRRKALSFLEKHGMIESYEYRKHGLSGFEADFYVTLNATPANFPQLIAMLKAEEDRRYPRHKIETDVSSAVARLLQLADSFHRVVLRLRDRRSGREPITMKDEYDVQYVFGALLETRFKDVRPEEWGPSHAGSASRADFLLKNESVLVEMKMTRDGLTDRKLGDELIIDIAHYKQHNIKALLCFVYDPDNRLKNPSGIENDLSKPTDGLDVRVLIRPKS